MRFNNLPMSLGKKGEDFIQYQMVYNLIQLITKDLIFIARERKPNTQNLDKKRNQNSI